MDISQNLQDREKIELFIQCRSLKDMDTFSKSDPQVILYLKNNATGSWTEFGKTEIIWDNLNPNFVKTFVLDYHFEKQQHLKFEVRDIDNEAKGEFDYIGSCECTLGTVVGSKHQTQVCQLLDEKNKKSGRLILRAEKVMHCQEHITIQFQGNKIVNTRFLLGKTCPFLRFYKISEQHAPLLIYQTETVKKNLNPLFQPKEINLGKFSNGDINAPIRCELWDYRTNGSHKNLGSFQFSAGNLINEPNREYIIRGKKQKIMGIFRATSLCVLKLKPQFLDFIRGGTQLALINAVDFTASNGDPDLKDSLHSTCPGKLNQYQQAMQNVGEILLQYDHDKKVPMYGFGGKPQMQNLHSDRVLHCFPMTGNSQDTEVYGMEGMLQVYQYCLYNVIFSGPTLFAPLVRETMRLCIKAKEDQKQNAYDDQYYILLIMTDGEIFDMDETKKCIVQSSHLPMSIIIIGIGDGDFTNMEILDGDEGLWDYEGNKAQRDLVQFVPYNKYKGNPTILAEQVLEELPLQVEEYMELVHRLPNQPPERSDSYSDIISMQGNNQREKQQSNSEYGANSRMSTNRTSQLSEYSNIQNSELFGKQSSIPQQVRQVPIQQHQGPFAQQPQGQQQYVSQVQQGQLF